MRMKFLKPQFVSDTITYGLFENQTILLIIINTTQITYKIVPGIITHDMFGDVLLCLLVVPDITQIEYIQNWYKLLLRRLTP